MMAHRAKTDATVERVWPVVPIATVNGRVIEPGRELTIEGLPGRATFVRAATQPDGSLILDVTTSRGRSRTVRADAVVRIHRSPASTAPSERKRKPQCSGTGQPGLDGSLAGESDRCRVCSRDHVRVSPAGVLTPHREGRTARQPSTNAAQQ
jgi:hypothetical protein